MQIRHYEFAPFEKYIHVPNAAGSTTEDLDTDRLEAGWIYYLMNLVGLCTGSGISQASIGYVSGNTFMIMKKRSADNPFETIEYHHEIILKETDIIRVRFYNATENDDLYLFANGIKRRM